jgi:hypothetical protein
LGGSRAGRLSAQLDDMSRLHKDLSAVAKNMLERDINLLKQLRTRWILLIDGIVTIVNRARSESK